MLTLFGCCKEVFACTPGAHPTFFPFERCGAAPVAVVSATGDIDEDYSTVLGGLAGDVSWGVGLGGAGSVVLCGSGFLVSAELCGVASGRLAWEMLCGAISELRS